MRLVTFAALAAAPLLMLGACTDPAPAPAPAPEPDPVPAAAMVGTLDLNQPFIARGNEPFWGVTFTPTTIELIAIDGPAQTAPNPGPVMGTGTATYTVTTNLNNTLVVTLTADPTCSDGMSETVYPAAATMVIGGVTKTGCAIAN
ncbi:hypothetical protein [Brevundimonas sp. TWP2-3-4b2]|uniref:hypothetical protein n=1 Tax=Brevundimonas sp. TWP2-3-4b2 TaxID=2804595 RepID=UPI003CECB371